MYLRRLVAFFGMAAGAGLGVALASSPTAAADAIDDAWPYGGTAPYYTPLGLPGYLEPGAVTSSGDLIYTHTYGGHDQWYSASDTTSIVPNVSTNDQQVVTGLLDSSATYPTVGTTFDQSDLFPVYNPAFGTIDTFQNTSLDDPKLGYADQSEINFVYAAFSNTYLSDAAGIKDISGFDGHYSTVFEIPFSTSSAGAAGAASDLGDGFQQLLTELTALSGSAPDLF
jgi:hypothetical protein